MNFSLQCAHPWIFYSIIPLIIALFWYKMRYTKPVRYRYSLAAFLETHNYKLTKTTFTKVSPLLHGILFFLLAVVLAQPRFVDIKSKVHVEGIDMMVVLDVSGSMQISDDQRDTRSRLQVAKQEAIKFIEQRENDPIGLVIFAYDAVSRCPLTLDKRILRDILHETQIGIINPSGTVLSLGIIMAANRLKNSKAKNKLMIVLTDGAPSPEDIPPDQAVAVAKKLGIKVYTIGIGYDGVRYFNDPLGGIQAVPGVNKELLTYIARQTGGRYFEAKKPNDMKKIYETINALEKTEYETQIFTNYHDIYKLFAFGAFFVALLELILSSLVWFVV